MANNSEESTCNMGALGFTVCQVLRYCTHKWSAEVNLQPRSLQIDLAEPATSLGRACFKPLSCPALSPCHAQLHQSRVSLVSSFCFPFFCINLKTFEFRISVTDWFSHLTDAESEVQLDEVVYMMTGGVKGGIPTSGLWVLDHILGFRILIHYEMNQQELSSEAIVLIPRHKSMHPGVKQAGVWGWWNSYSQDKGEQASGRETRLSTSSSRTEQLLRDGKCFPSGVNCEWTRGAKNADERKNM